jgi:hypothetical protein
MCLATAVMVPAPITTRGTMLTAAATLSPDFSAFVSFASNLSGLRAEATCLATAVIVPLPITTEGTMLYALLAWFIEVPTLVEQPQPEARDFDASMRRSSLIDAATNPLQSGGVNAATMLKAKK